MKKEKKGFTLIELLVVVAIIGLLASIVLIGLQSARQKSRNAKRLGDMTQMNTALELYFAANKGYPSSTTAADGSKIPAGLTPGFASSLPSDPLPPDGGCELVNYPAPAAGNGSNYYYVPSGTTYLAPDGVTPVFPDYAYYFCLGQLTGNFQAGQHILTPHGVK